MLDRIGSVKCQYMKPSTWKHISSSLLRKCYLQNYMFPKQYIYIYIRKILTENTTILEHQNDKQKRQILEALHIRNIQPKLNKIYF